MLKIFDIHLETIGPKMHIYSKYEVNKLLAWIHISLTGIQYKNKDNRKNIQDFSER